MADPILKFLAAFESRTKLLWPFSAEFGNLVSKSLVRLNLDSVSDWEIHWFREEIMLCPVQLPSETMISDKIK